MRKSWILSVFLGAILALCVSHNVAAATQVTVTLNGEQLSFDVPPVVEDGRVLVPLRAIFEALGAEVDWNSRTDTATAIKDEDTIMLVLGDITAYINTVPVTLDVPAKAIDGRILVPLRFVSEALGAEVSWYNPSQTVQIIRKEEETTEPLLNAEFISGEPTSLFRIPGLVLADGGGNILYECKAISRTKYLVRFDSSLGNVDAEQIMPSDSIVKKISISKNSLTNETTIVFESDTKLYYKQDMTNGKTDFEFLISASPTFDYTAGNLLGGNTDETGSVSGTEEDHLETTGDRAVALALDYIGVPYVWGGTSPSGFDCSGFMFYIYKQLGITLPRVAADQAASGTAVARGSLQPGDLVFFYTDSSRPNYVAHTGMYIGNGEFIHSSSSAGCVIISSMDTSYYSARFAGGRRYWD